MKTLANYEQTILDMVNQCANSGINTAQQMANIGRFEPMYLYFKPSTESDNGELLLIPDTDAVPDGYELATGEGLRCNIPFNEYFRWVKARVSRLPILCPTAYKVAA
jgi:hypothetical protein